MPSVGLDVRRDVSAAFSSSSGGDNVGVDVVGVGVGEGASGEDMMGWGRYELVILRVIVMECWVFWRPARRPEKSGKVCACGDISSWRTHDGGIGIT